MGYITRDMLIELAQELSKSTYGDYLLSVANG